MMEERDPVTEAPPVSITSKMSVVIVNHNTREHLAACLSTLEREAAEVIIVDNASGDGSVEMVATGFPWVKLQANESNPGYGAGANQAVALSECEYILLLNSDTRVEPGAVAALTEYLDEHPEVAIAGPMLLNPDGSRQPSCYPFPTPVNLLFRWTTLGLLAAHSPRLRHRYPPAACNGNAQPVAWVVGAALAIRRSAFEAVDGFDETFFMYSEEVDLCYRLWDAGWEVHFAPVTTVWHEGGVSTVQYRATMAAQLYLSNHHFYRRHYSPRRLMGFRMIVTYLMLRNLVRDRLRLLQIRGSVVGEALREDMGVWRRVLNMVWTD
jgi:GT2 family glycosyltransferase